MNEVLKQRIVGAAVIIALAAIFIPMLFDDPVPDADSYTNEISLPQEPVNNMQPLIDDLPKNKNDVLSRPKAVQVDLQEKIIKETRQQAKLQSWVIQVGSFSQKQNADEFRDKLRKQKFTAYVDSVKAERGTLYRLRVGPELDEKRALKTQKRLESLYKIKTLLVSE